MKKFPQTFLILSICLIALQVYVKPETLDRLLPIALYKMQFNAQFMPEDEVNVYTYLPVNNERQHVLNEEITDFGMQWYINTSEDGRKIQFSGQEENQLIEYQHLLYNQNVQFQIDEQMSLSQLQSQIGQQEKKWLVETQYVQVSHPEVAELWQSIKPVDEDNLHQVLTAIYQFTYKELESVEFKGTTDALTALRLRLASCNGKSRLFVALARLNDIPARLVGGYILDNQKKKTTHQWVEVKIGSHWVPFGPTNGHFASLPANYVRLYTGDHSLFRYTSNINFDYAFKGTHLKMSQALYLDQIEPTFKGFNISKILMDLGMTPKTIAILLIFPLCALVIVFFKTIIGLKTFGSFTPLLIAVACVYSGLTFGLMGFSVLIIMAWLVHWLCYKFRLLKIARLGLVVCTLLTAFIILLNVLDAQLRYKIGFISFFPVVIIGFMSDKIFQTTSEHQWGELIHKLSSTILVIIICYLLLSSSVLLSGFSLIPSLYLLVFSLLLVIGTWGGLRLNERFRFQNIFSDDGQGIIGMNWRNREIIYKHNDQKYLRLAADKLKSKKILSTFGIPVSNNILKVDQNIQIDGAIKQLFQLNDFVVKPNNGSQGNGIVVVVDVEDQTFVTAGRKRLTMSQMKEHMGDIISGRFSQHGDTDVLYVEPRIHQVDYLQNIAPFGLSDIRIIVVGGAAISAMLRMPCSGSNGKANLHQGAVGVAINMLTGKTEAAFIKGKSVELHPDTQQRLIDIQIEQWAAIKSMAQLCYGAVPLSYLGVDICIDAKNGPLVLEVNGRPGLEIQNVVNKGMQDDVDEKLNKAIV